MPKAKAKKLSKSRKQGDAEKSGRKMAVANVNSNHSSQSQDELESISQQVLPAR